MGEDDDTGRKDDDEGRPDDDGDDDGGSEGGGDDDDGDDDYVAPTREEAEKMRATMRARKQERDAARAELRRLREQLKNADGKGGDEGKSREDERGGDEDVRWRRTAARSSAASQLTAAGFSGTAKQAKRLTALLDLESAEPDRDGDFDFEDEIADLKDEYPMLFRAPDDDGGRARRRPSTADRSRDVGRDDTDDATTRTSKAMLRKMGRPIR